MKKRINRKQESEEWLNFYGEPAWVKEIIDGVPQGQRHVSAIRLVDRFLHLGLHRIPPWAQQIIRGVPQGMRYASAIRLVGWCYGLGLYTQEVVLFLLGWNSRNIPPMDKEEISNIIKSTSKWERVRYTPYMSDEEAHGILEDIKKQMRGRR